MTPPPPRRPLGSTVVTLIVIDAVLIAILAILLVQSQFGRTPGAGPEAAPETISGSLDPTVEDVVFASPTRNITCAISEDAATCSIAEFTYDPPEIADCEGLRGHEVTVTADGPAWACTEGEAPGPAADDTRVLAYGDTVSLNGFTCASAESGMTCGHDESGRSFTLARAGATFD